MTPRGATACSANSARSSVRCWVRSTTSGSTTRSNSAARGALLPVFHQHRFAGLAQLRAIGLKTAQHRVVVADDLLAETRGVRTAGALIFRRAARREERRQRKLLLLGQARRRSARHQNREQKDRAGHTLPPDSALAWADDRAKAPGKPCSWARATAHSAPCPICLWKSHDRLVAIRKRRPTQQFLTVARVHKSEKSVISCEIVHRHRCRAYATALTPPRRGRAPAGPSTT